MRSACVVTLATGFFFGLFGCSSDRDAIEKRLSALSEDISRVQAENDRLGERVGALEVKGASPAPKTADRTPQVERQPLKVIKLVPGGGESGADADPSELAPEDRPDAPGNRPVIRVRGSAKETRSDESRASTGSIARQSEETK
jgi:hypothetical protein